MGVGAVPKSQAEAVSYIVFKEGSLVKAKNGLTGNVEYSGTDATTVIQAAINALPPGGKIFIKRGVYLITTRIDLISNLTITGEGQSTILRNNVTRPAILGSIFYAEDKVGITIEEIYFDGNLTALGAAAGFEGLIHFVGVKNSKIINNYLYDSYSNPINLRFSGTNNPEFISVIGNICYGHNGDAGIQIIQGDRCIVSHNKMTGGSGIYLRDACYRCIVANNILYPNHGGVNVDGGNYGDFGVSLYLTQRTIVSNNLIYDAKTSTGNTTGIGITLNSANQNLVIGNTIEDCEASAIRLLNCNLSIVTQNQLTNNCLSGAAAERDEILVDATAARNRNDVTLNQIVETGGQKCVNAISVDANHSFCVVEHNKIYYITPAILDNGTSTRINYNVGHVTENNVLSPAFAIDAVAVVTVTIPHGLAVTPAIEDCQLTVVEDTNVDDWEEGYIKVESVGAANVVAKVNVTTASATGGATAKLLLRVNLT